LTNCIAVFCWWILSIEGYRFLKKGRRGSIWSGRWLFHADWFDETGRKDRKNFITILLIELILVAIFFAAIQS